MSKPRILIFIDWFLPGYKAGGPIQSCANLVEHLKEVFDFWVITRDTDYCETEPYTSVTPDTWNELAPYLQVFYCSAENLKYSALYKAARVARPDMIYINGIFSFYFSVLPLRMAKSLGCKHKIVSARGMMAPSALQVKGNKKKWFLRAIKLLDLYNGVRFHATNDKELLHIRQVLRPKQEVIVAPNLPKPVLEKLPQRVSKATGELKLVSIARIAPEKNTLFAIQVLFPLKPDIIVSLDLYGPVYDQAYWQKCQAEIEGLLPNVKVNYHGSIANELVHDTLQQYHALFLPTRGENFGHIILESLAAGIPVLISDQTPWRNLQEKHVGFDLPLDAPERFVEAIHTLAQMTNEEFSSKSKAATAFAKEYMIDPAALEKNRKLFSF